MAAPKFAQGDRVTVLAMMDNPNVRPGVYEIVRLLPESGEGRRYRAKNTLDAHERVIRETDLVMA